MARSTEDTDRLAQEEVAELYVLQGRPDQALPLYAEVLARQPHRSDIRDRMRSLTAACRQSASREDTRPIPIESLAAAHELADRPDKALELLAPLLERRPADAQLAAWVGRLRRITGLLGALLCALPTAPAEAKTSAVAALRGGDRAATDFAAALLAEEIRARGGTTMPADGVAATACGAKDAPCLHRVAMAHKADDLYLIEVRTGADRWTVDIGRFTPAAGTLEQIKATLQGGAEARAGGLRSRLARFLRDPNLGRKKGAILVRTAPPGATVFVDGEEVGAAPIIVDDLYAGLHLVAARRADRAPAERTAMVGAGGLTEVVVPMKPGVDGYARPGTRTLVLTGLALVATVGAGLLSTTFSATQREFDDLGDLNVGNVERATVLANDGKSQALTATLLWSGAAAALLGAGLSYWGDWRAAYEGEEGR